MITDIDRALNLIRGTQASLQLDAETRGDDRLLTDWSYQVAAALWPVASVAFTERAVPYTLDDVVRWFCKRLKTTTEWTLDAIIDRCDEDIEVETDALHQLNTELFGAVRNLIPNMSTYSDGRPVQTSIRIEDGHRYTHTWHPDPALNVPSQFQGKLLADPGQDNGTYTMHIIPPSMLMCEVNRPTTQLNDVDTQGDGE